MPNLQSKLYISKQKLKAKSEKLKYHKKLFERKSINRKFSCDPKSVYRTMKGNCKRKRRHQLKMRLKHSGKASGKIQMKPSMKPLLGCVN